MHKLIFMHHLEAVQAWAHTSGVHVHLASGNLTLTLSRGGQHWLLVPRFVQQTAGKLSYTHLRQKDTTFVGWVMPDTPKINLAQDRKIFKKFATDAGLLVPSDWSSGTNIGADFVIKNRKSSLGGSIKGPFKTSTPPLPLADGEFYEQFVVGQPMRAWFWSDQVVALEVVDQPYLLGDGVRTVAALLQPRGSIDVPLPIKQAEAYLNWQGLGVNTVLADQQKAYLSFSHSSSFHTPKVVDVNVLGKTHESVRAQLTRAAKQVMHRLSSVHQKDFLYTLDGVLDARARIWFLEISNHPMVHPSVYPHMLNSLILK